MKTEQGEPVGYERCLSDFSPSPSSPYSQCHLTANRGRAVANTREAASLILTTPIRARSRMCRARPPVATRQEFEGTRRCPMTTRGEFDHFLADTYDSHCVSLTVLVLCLVHLRPHSPAMPDRLPPQMAILWALLAVHTPSSILRRAIGRFQQSPTLPHLQRECFDRAFTFVRYSQRVLILLSC